jgi:hypothetical protein
MLISCTGFLIIKGNLFQISFSLFAILSFFYLLSCMVNFSSQFNSPRLTGILDSISQGIAGRRCHTHIHCLDSQKRYSVLQLKEIWKDAGAAFQAAITCLDPCQLLRLIKLNLQANHFCECCGKGVLTAFKILAGQAKRDELSKEENSAFSAKAYEGFTFNEDLQMIQVSPSPELFNKLIGLAAATYLDA